MKIPLRLRSILVIAILLCAFHPVMSQSIRFTANSLPVDPSGYGHGASFGAFTRNGRPSLFVISYGTANYLFNNIGASFTDIAADAGVQFGTEHDRGMAAADFDNDGDTDIYISAGYTGNVLWRNNGDDTFTDITSESGTFLNGQGQGVAWGDFNNDGWLDLFVAQTDGGNRLYIQSGGGRFYESSGGISSHSESLQPVAFDVNDDGYVDILVTRRSGSNNLLYLNGGGGGFGEEAGSWRIGFGGANSQGAAVNDYDRDGDLDIFICDFSGHNLLFRNMGGYFDEVGGSAGIRSGNDGNRGALFGDFNDDGWPDIYVTRSGDNKMFQNNGNGTFTEVSSSSGANDGNDGYSPSMADYDNDGDLDIFFTNTGQNSILLENLGPFNNWIDFRLRGSGSNLNGIGAKLTAWVNGRPQAQAIIAGQGYLGTGSDLNAHFGLGSSSVLDSLIVKWPSGTLDKYFHLAANQKLTLYEGNAPPSDRTAPKISSVTANNVGTTTVTINWQTDENADAQIEYGHDTNYGSFSVLDGNFTTTHTVTLANLTASTLYHFRVRAKDTAGNLAVSNDFTFTTTRDTQAPTLTKITASDITMTTAKISWTSDEPADAQVEYGRDTNYGSLSALDNNFAATHALTLANLTANTLYHYRVRSQDAAGNLALSSDFTFTTARDTQAPVLTNIATGEITMTTAKISWSSDEPADAQIEYGHDNNYGLLSKLDTNLIKTHALALSNLTMGTTYHYRVRSRDAAGNLAMSNDSTFTTLRDTQAPEISNLEINAITANSAQIKWTTNEPSEARVDYGTDSTAVFAATVDTNFVTAHMVILSNLKSYTTYYFRITAKDKAGNSRSGAKQTFTTLPTVAGVIAFAGDAQNGRANEILPLPLVVRVVNSAGTNVVNEKVEFRVTAGGGRVLGEAGCDSTFCVAITNQFGLAMVKWRLGATDSQRIKVTLPAKNDLVLYFTATLQGSITSVEEAAHPLPTALALRNYPNPFHEFTQFDVALPAPGTITLKIFDLQGREVITLVEGIRNAGNYSFNWQTQSPSERRLAAGIYFAVLKYRREPANSSGETARVLVQTQRLFYSR